MSGRPALAALLLAGAAAGCSDHEFQPPSREQQVAEAEAAYSPAMFDTVTWASDSLRLFTGNEIFAARCRKCHGPLGAGGTNYAAEQDLDVPSLVEPDWQYAGDLEALRRRIFTGHPQGMPTWGVAGLDPRAMDAVAWYVIEGLRPEVLDTR